jgi:acetylornithine/N-succinyldiaminopimelate aminotransferase
MCDYYLEDTESLLDQAEKSLLFNTKRPGIVMNKGKGMYLWDTDGKKYLDFIGGWAVTCLGHCPDVIAQALQQQAGELINASPAFYNTPMINFSKLLTDHSCFDRAFFLSTGAEANESAIKLARKYGRIRLNGAYEIITAINSFHGRTLATMAATGKKQWETLFQPKVEGFKHVCLNDLDAMLAAINEKTCAIMFEPIQGEGGVFAVEQEYIRKIRKVCDEKGILLIFDEVQTGLGRTGKLFAYEHYGIEPDIMTLAKGIGGGFPLSAMLAKEEFNLFEQGDQGGTYCGQPLAMAVGYAVVKEIIDRNISEKAQIMGEYIQERLRIISCEFGLKHVRGMGLLIAFDLPGENAAEFVQRCLEYGLIVNSPKPSVIRLMPPLIVRKKEVDELFDILCVVLKTFMDEVHCLTVDK